MGFYAAWAFRFAAEFEAETILTVVCYVEANS